MADQLCTKAQVKARAGITDVTDDTMIDEIIDQVSDEVQQFTGRKLVPEAGVTYVFDTLAGHTLAIPRGIRTVTSISVAATDQPDTGGVYQAVTTPVLIRPLPANRRPGWPGLEIRLTASPISTLVPFRTVANGASVVGDFGFAATPPSVQRIAIAASVAEYLDRRRAGQAGPDGIDLPRLLEADDLALLARFQSGVGMGIG